MPAGKPLIVVVGGFLGAGKTSLILAATRELRRGGTRVAVITNDQGENLVDTHRVRAHDIDAAEIGGGCFCCRFSDLVEALDQVAQFEPEVIFAEPVGSCTDLAATVLKPLQALYRDRYRVAPFTVLMDPETARRAIGGTADSSIRFLFESQIREADILCYTKADRHSEFPAMGNDEPLRVSAVTGEGVAAWLELVHAWEGSSGAHTLTIDYDEYAAAEASLGWLNAHVQLDLTVPASPSHVIGPLLEQLDNQLSAVGATIVHLKLFDRTDSSYLIAGVVHNGQEPSVDGDLLATAEHRHELTINLRAIATPEQLRQVVEEAMELFPGVADLRVQAFAPAYPRPEKRMTD